MADLFRVRIPITGAGVVGASVMTLYVASPSSGWTSNITTWLNAIKANVPPSVTFQIPNSGDRVDVATGALSGSWTDGSASSVTGTGVGGFAIGVGARIVWDTAGIVSGRRVRGSTFLVPLMSGTFDSSGRMQPATVTSLNTPTQSFLTAMAGTLTIWSRPRTAQPSHVPPITARVGSAHPVLSATVKTDPATLRSRRT